MNVRKWLCMMFVCLVMMNWFMPNVEATQIEPENFEIEGRAANRFNMNVSANKSSVADSSFYMEEGQSITIIASYSPQSASVDFGVIGPDGLFYYKNTTSGSIYITFDISERGSYTLAIRNNSSKTISVSGQVNY